MNRFLYFVVAFFAKFHNNKLKKDFKDDSNTNKKNNNNQMEPKSNDLVFNHDFEITKVEETKFLNLEKIDLTNIGDLFDSYATKKTYATGFFNLALIANNFSQLVHLLSLEQPALYCILNLIIMSMVCISLVLQVVVSGVLIYLAKSGEFMEEEQRANLIRKNNLVTFLIIAISIINVMVNVFLSVSSG